MNFCARGYICYRQSGSILFGLCMGITLSLLLTPISDEDCSRYNVQLHHPSRSPEPPPTTADDYNPRINTRNKPKTKEPHEKVIRPRHYSAELGLKAKILVAVISSKDTIKSLGQAINATLSHHVDKVVFFIDVVDKKQIPNSLKSMTVVGFPKDRPILKPFHILRYLGDNYVNEFDFIFLVNDDTYVRGMAIRTLAERISVAKDVYMGAKINETNALYCKLSSGILLSRTTLLPVLRNLDWCTRNAFSDSDDDNLGRCVLHSTNTPCMERVQGHRFASHSFRKGSDSRKNIINLLDDKRLSNILTVSSIGKTKNIYELHRLFAELEVIETEYEISQIENEITEMKPKDPKRSDLVWPLGSYPPFRVTNRFDVIQWQYFTPTDIFLTSDFENGHRLTGIDLQDVGVIINSSFAILPRNDHLVFSRIVSGYRRFDPTRGMEYLIDVEFKDTFYNSFVLKRLEGVRPLGDVEMISVPYVTETTRVTLVLKVNANNRQEAARFVDAYAKVCMENQDNTVLMVVFIYDLHTTGSDKNDFFNELKTKINSYVKKFQTRNSKIAQMNVKSPGLKPSEFGVMDLVVRKYPAETLFLVCQSGMEIKAEYLNRVRMNTIKGVQIFSPIPFVQYHPDIVFKGKSKIILDVNKNYGHFDSYNFDHLSFYSTDYLAGRKSIESKVPIVKLDKDLKNMKHQRLPFGIYEMFLNMTKLHVLRAVEPALLQHFQLKSCVSTLTEEAHNKCLMSRHLGLASRSQLAELVFSRKNKKENLVTDKTQFTNQSPDLR